MIAPNGLAGKPQDVGVLAGGRTTRPDGLPIGTFYERVFLPRDSMPPNAVFCPVLFGFRAPLDSRAKSKSPMIAGIFLIILGQFAATPPSSGNSDAPALPAPAPAWPRPQGSGTSPRGGRP
jgi:hypothetical protein